MWCRITSSGIEIYCIRRMDGDCSMIMDFDSKEFSISLPAKNQNDPEAPQNKTFGELKRII